MILPGTERDEVIHPIDVDDSYSEYSPGGEDSDELDDEDDEAFDDMAGDENDLHDIIVEENIDDADDDDHLPEEHF